MKDLILHTVFISDRLAASMWHSALHLFERCKDELVKTEDHWKQSLSSSWGCWLSVTSPVKSIFKYGKAVLLSLKKE